MPAHRSPDKPAPVALTSGDQTFATAYARRAPSPRQPCWEWRMSTQHPTTGQRVMTSLGRLPQEAVAAALAEAYREIDPIAVADDGSGVRTVADLLAAWLYDMEQRAPGGPRHAGDGISAHTLRNAVGASKRLIAAAGSLKLKTATVGELLQLRDGLTVHYQPRTVRLDLKVLKQAWTWGLDRSVPLAPVQWRRVKARVIDDDYANNHATPTHAEVERVYRDLRRCGLKLGLYIGWRTGARIGEIAALRWGDLVEDPDGTWLCLQGKTGRRRFPLKAEDAATIRSFRPPGRQEHHPMIGGYFNQNGSTNLKVACERLQVPPFTFHGLRRLMTDTCLRAGVEVGTYAKLMGHSIEEALRVYRTPTGADLQGALAQIRPGQGDGKGTGLRLVEG